MVNKINKIIFYIKKNEGKFKWILKEFNFQIKETVLAIVLNFYIYLFKKCYL